MGLYDGVAMTGGDDALSFTYLLAAAAVFTAVAFKFTYYLQRRVTLQRARTTSPTRVMLQRLWRIWSGPSGARLDPAEPGWAERDRETERERETERG